MDDSIQNSSAGTGDRRLVLACLLLFAVAMAYLESAVVVYLRAIYYPEGFSFPLKALEPDRALVEIGRELSTVIMLAAVAYLAAAAFYERFAAFCIMFGVWDIFYYFWLKVLLNWPQSLFTWDVLFLIPIPWIGPVLSPLVVAVSLVVGGGAILYRIRSGGSFAPNLWDWAIALGGAALIILSYMKIGKLFK